MQWFKRTIILSCILTIILTIPSFLVAQTKEDILSKGQQLLRQYTPVVEKAQQPTETPEQAWKRTEQEQQGKKQATVRSGNAAKKLPLTVTQEQKKKRVEEGNTKQSVRDIRDLMTQKIRQDEQQGKGLVQQLRQRGINAAEKVTPEERKEQIAQNQQQNTNRALNTPTRIEEERKKLIAYLAEHPEMNQPEAGILGNLVISGYVFNDENHNGIKDSLETGISGITVWYSRAYYSGYGSDTTDSSGYYEFPGLEGGDYFHIYTNDITDLYQTAPVDYWYYCNTIDTTLKLNLGFWKVPPRSIAGVVYNDLNHNGIRDTLEPGLSNWRVWLYQYSNSQSFSTLSDSEGNYSFDNLLAVSYYEVYMDEQYRWVPTEPSSGYYYFRLFDTSYQNLNFGKWFLPPYAISGTKFDDQNGNGYRDEGEPGIPGWTINIYRYYDGASFQVVTDSMGEYFHRDSCTETYFYVYEENQEGWLTTYPYQSQSAYYYFYGAGDTLTDKTFGNWHVPPASIQGTVYDDSSNNGNMDPGEQGLSGWKVFAVNEDGDTLSTYSDSIGGYSFTGLAWGYYYIFEEENLNWIRTQPNEVAYYIYVIGDTSTGIDFGNYLPPLTPLRVNTMPSNDVSPTYANALVNQELDVWGNVHGGRLPYHYILEYGDGTMDSGEAGTGHYIGFKHTYMTAGTKTMRLIITDAEGQSDSDQSVIRVYPVSSSQIRTNMAIEKGLLYLYLNQYPSGYWADYSNTLASTGAAILSFEENGHKPNNDINRDIYAEYVRLGLNYLLSNAQTQSIGVQSAGDPDTDHDSKGAYLTNNTYANGIANLAVIGAYASAVGAQSDTITVGAYAGQTFYDYAVDMVDQWAYSQTDANAGTGRGGWRYSVATASDWSQDNSTTQWATLDLEAAQNTWGITIPQFVKDELLYALQYTQGSDGGFGYTDPDYWENITKTAAGIGSYALRGASTATPAVSSAIGFLDTHWNDQGRDSYGWDHHLSGNTYAMYGVAKGLRIINNRGGEQFVGSHDWYAEYVDHLLDHPTWKQNDDGSWPRSSNAPCSYMGDPLNSSLAILVLTRGVVVSPPVAVIAPLSGMPPNTPLQVDGSGSFHQDPEKTIVEWLWDFNTGDGVNWEFPDASGPRPTNPGYADTGTYTISLRVKDNSEPPLYSITTTTVRIRSEQNPPIAVAIPPERGTSYAARIGEPIFLDGSASYDPDYPRDSIIAYSWDLDGNGEFGDATTDTVTVVFINEHQGQVGLRVYDTRGDSSTNIAYITIVASRKDLYVESFHVETDSLYPSGQVVLTATVKNDENSNTNVSHVLVRFYDHDPTTIGNQIGQSFYVDLPIGDDETVQTTVQLPPGVPRIPRQFFVYLDPLNQVTEWDELNNIARSTPDVSIESFAVLPESVYVGDTVQVRAVFHNVPESNIELHHVLVTFSLAPGMIPEHVESVYVDLPAGGFDTVDVAYPLAFELYGGTTQLYAYADADNQVVETNEENNLATVSLTLLTKPALVLLSGECLNFATLPPTQSRTLDFNVQNGGEGMLWIDSIISASPSFTVSGEMTKVAPGESIPIEVTFTPAESGTVISEVLLYTSEGIYSVQLLGQGELEYTDDSKELFIGHADVNGSFAPPGSVVGVFTVNGELITSTLVSDLGDGNNYALSVWFGQAGIQEDDPLFFKVWTPDCRWKSERYCEPFVTFIPSEGDTAPTVYHVHAADPVTVSIPLGPKFNAVSWNVMPEQNEVDSVFESLLGSGKVTILLDYNASDTVQPYFDYYIPDLGEYNTFKMTDFRKGYLVKLHSDVTEEVLPVHGTPVCPTVPIPLNGAFNFVSYLPNFPESTMTALSSIIGENFNVALEFVNDGFGGGIFNYFPAGNLNEMHPGRGYLIHVTEPDTLQYPALEIPPSAKTSLAMHALAQPPTTIHVPLAVFAYGTEVKIGNVPVPAGTPIRAVDADGVICGSATFVADGVFVMPVFADDPTTPGDEGALPGEQVRIIIGTNQLVSQRIEWTEFADTPRLDGNLSVTGVSDPTGLPAEFGLSQNYPNPFNPVTTIRYQLPVESSVKLTVYSLIGQRILTLVDGVQSAGYKTAQFDAGNLPNGVYYYRLEATSTSGDRTSFSQVRKMTLVK